jgi:hypothetical protein
LHRNEWHKNNKRRYKIICKTSILGMSIKEKFINMKERKTGTSSFNFKNSFIYMFKNISNNINIRNNSLGIESIFNLIKSINKIKKSSFSKPF